MTLAFAFRASGVLVLSSSLFANSAMLNAEGKTESEEESASVKKEKSLVFVKRKKSFRSF